MSSLIDVMIIATKDCSHYASPAKELDEPGVEFLVLFAEDEPELVRKYGIRHSPNLIMDDVVKFRRQPTEHEVRERQNC